jgi:HlyD family secretion protein
MFVSSRRLICLLLLATANFWMLCEPGISQEPEVASIQPEVGPFQKTISMAGYFAPNAATEISVSLETSLSLKVVNAAEHGARVRAGDLLVEFDARDAKEQLQQQEFAMAMQKLTLEEADRENHIARLRDPLDEQFAELAKRRADEDFASFTDREFPMSQRSVEQSMKSMKDYFDYTAEELRQLEKMYRADDLTEESEEIVLRRAKDDLERARFALEREELNYRRSVDLNVPRDKVNAQSQHRLAEIAWEQFRTLRPLLLEKRQIALKKMRMDVEKGERELAKFRSDLKKFRIEAPHDGTVYFGKSTDGKFGNILEMQSKLRAQGSVSPNEILMTVVKAGSLAFVGSIPESEVALATCGSVANIVPTAYPQSRLEARVQHVAPIPGPDGTFQVHLELQDDAPKKAVAGMTGRAKWIAYFNAKALSIPNRYVHRDADNDDASYVFVLDSESKPVKQWVEAGVATGDRTEIVSGLAPDAKVVESDGSKK